MPLDDEDWENVTEDVRKDKGKGFVGADKPGAKLTEADWDNASTEEPRDNGKGLVGKPKPKPAASGKLDESDWNNVTAEEPRDNGKGLVGNPKPKPAASRKLDESDWNNVTAEGANRTNGKGFVDGKPRQAWGRVPFQDDDWGEDEDTSQQDRRRGKGIVAKPSGKAAPADEWGDVADTAQEDRRKGKGLVGDASKTANWVAASKQGGLSLEEYADIDSPIAKAEEIIKGRMTQEPVSDEHLKVLFSLFDHDKNGFISKEEFRRLYQTLDKMGCETDVIGNLLTKYNMLGDDRLSFNEFSILVCKVLGF